MAVDWTTPGTRVRYASATETIDGTVTEAVSGFRGWPVIEWDDGETESLPPDDPRITPLPPEGQ